MDWKQLWEILSAADNVPIIAMIPLLAFYMYLAWKQAHANDVLIEQLAGDAALAKTHHRKAWPFKPGWAKEVHVWPFLPARGIPGRYHRHHHLDGLVHHFERTSRRTGKPQPHHEPGESTVVFPRLAGNAGLLRSLDRGGGHAHPDHRRPDGHSLHRYQPAWRRLLHLEAAQVCHRNISLRLHHLVGFDDFHRHVYPRPRLAVVLARADLGPQPPHL